MSNEGVCDDRCRFRHVCEMIVVWGGRSGRRVVKFETRETRAGRENAMGFRFNVPRPLTCQPPPVKVLPSSAVVFSTTTPPTRWILHRNASLYTPYTLLQHMDGDIPAIINQRLPGPGQRPTHDSNMSQQDAERELSLLRTPVPTTRRPP
jgi:hypothetical protein